MNHEERNQDTLPTLETIADMLKLLNQNVTAGFQMMGERLDRLENRVGQLENRVGQLENRVGQLENQVNQLENRLAFIEAAVEEVRVQVVGVNVRLERLGAVVQNGRADTMVLQEEVHAWARDVQVLQRKVDTLAG